MSDIPKMKLDFQGLYTKSKENPEMPEEELRTLFNKIDILGNLGYNAIGKDIRLELYLKAVLSSKKVTKGEKIWILVPRGESLTKDALEHWHKINCQELKKWNRR